MVLSLNVAMNIRTAGHIFQTHFELKRRLREMPYTKMQS